MASKWKKTIRGYEMTDAKGRTWEASQVNARGWRAGVLIDADFGLLQHGTVTYRPTLRECQARVATIIKMEQRETRLFGETL